MQQASEREGEHNGPVRGNGVAPPNRGEGCREDDDAHDADERDAEGDAEAAEDLGDLKEEVGALDFLLGGSPLDVVAEEVGEEGFAQVNGETAEEEEAVNA